MSENLRSDGKAVDVTLGNAFANVNIVKGDLVYAEGWFGVAMANGTKGDTIALEVTNREFAFNVGTETAAKGAILYADLSSGDGKITLTDDATHTSGSDAVPNTKIVKVTKAKDSNNIVWAKLLSNEA